MSPLNRFVELIAAWPWQQIGVIVITALVGFLIARLLSKLVGSQVESKMDSTSGMIASKITFYFLLVVVVAVILRELDVSLGALLAAGGFLGLALGFAAQTSVSNMISGIFLIFERPFNVGDVIKIEGEVGFVLSIDLLSTKLRTFDNLYRRVPNEKVLKSDITTITKYDIRRLDINTSISYDDDIEVARETLLEVAEDHHLVMGDPEPVVLVTKMGESGIELILRCWFYKTDYITLLTELTHRVKVALEEAGCTIPFPHKTVYVRNEEDWEKAAALEENN
ncbi:MAG: mechanosensitive ion channel family protein [bacterium]